MSLSNAVASLFGPFRGKDRRAASRFSVQSLPVMLDQAGTVSGAECRDISSSGLRLAIVEPIRVYDLVIVRGASNFAIRGQVTWVSGAECGIEFEEPAVFQVVVLDEPGSQPRSERLYALPDRRSAFLAGADVKVAFSGQRRSAQVQWCEDNQAKLLLVD